MIKLHNLYLGLRDQLPIKRAFRNFLITGNAWGLFSKRSHLTAKGGEKVMYNTKATAVKSATAMQNKTGQYFSTYKCVFCDGYHLGRNRDSK